MERARRARDARFDGRFFIGVATTGIYCRPICPAAPPKPANVRYFPSAAAAAEAGFRPCLRCRPEASPGTPAWLGSSATVSRALKLIALGVLDSIPVEELAGRLGIGGRHLRRLFLKHLGATPIAVAQTHRLHSAKKLIDETSLPFTQIAFSSGFRSIRRFNAAFQDLYGRTPSELRRMGSRPREREKPHEYRFKMSFRPPYDWNSLISFLAARVIPGIESMASEGYRRTISLSGKSGFIEVRPSASEPCLEVRVHFPDPGFLLFILERVRRMFDLGADPGEISAHLRRDPLLRHSVALRPGLRIPGAWDGFEMAVRAVLGQQVSVRGAGTLTKRLVETCGERSEHGPLFPEAGNLLKADLKSIGLTRSKEQTLKNLAEAVHSRAISFDGSQDLTAFVKEFTTIRGIGEWTAHYVAMRALGEPDAFPSGDLILLRRTESAEGNVSPKSLTARAEPWRPWRSYAAMHIWAQALASAAPPKTAEKGKERIRP